jgi:hypothetical protein
MEMSDSELLAMAAKAAGYSVFQDPQSPGAQFERLLYLDIRGVKPWNPLADDGDALRLAVKLGLDVDISFEVTFIRHDAVNNIAIDHESDAYAATRRAIVMVAAEIGKNMVDTQKP